MMLEKKGENPVPCGRPSSGRAVPVHAGAAVIFVSKIAPNIYESKYTFSALTCIIT